MHVISVRFSGLVGLLALVGLTACDEQEPLAPDAGQAHADVEMDASLDAGSLDAGPAPVDVCAELELPERPFDADGPYGIHRGEVAEDFTVTLVGGETWTLSDHWSGCESYVFLPDLVSAWGADVDGLIALSPRNAQYFFVSSASNDADAATSRDAMTEAIDAALADIADAREAAFWRERLHVIAGRTGALGSWLDEELAQVGLLGFAIDRSQRLRGIGSLADVTRPTGSWPADNLAYLAHEVRYFNAQAALEARLAGETVTEVTLFDGVVLGGGPNVPADPTCEGLEDECEFVEVELPSAAEMAAFDTLEVEVRLACPNPEWLELAQPDGPDDDTNPDDNCGAWDYLAWLALEEIDEVTAERRNVELARFVTPYHREAHWVVDISQMLPLLRDGGLRRFRWEWAPPWNPQATETHITLRFSNRGKPARPVELVPLVHTWGLSFDGAYNAMWSPIEVPIPADATRVELFAIISGHGAAEGNNCAEFCNHAHELTVNGTAHLREHPEAGTQQGCIAQIENGMTPNQAGTWWYGRGGWCPGQQIDPWVVDVTADVAPGETATVSYRGLFRSASGLGEPMGGTMSISSYLVIYR